MTFYFVSRVIKAVDEGKEQELLKKRERLSEVRKNVKEELVEFLSQEHISRAVPGRKVSLGYGETAVLHKLLLSKAAIIEQFQTTLDQNYSQRTLLQYWPRNFRTPRSADRERNCCPQHDSFGRLLSVHIIFLYFVFCFILKNMIFQALQSVDVAKNIPNSCRVAAHMSLCQRGTDPLDPIGWHESCSLSDCDQCPGLTVETGQNVDESQTFSFLEWRNDTVAKTGKDGKPRKVFTLHESTVTISEGIKLLKEKAKKLAGHIFVAYQQWWAKKITVENLAYGTLCLVADYQQNLTVQLSATPTSTAYGANQTNVCVYPIAVYYRPHPDKEVVKGSITFASDDLLHCHQQVRAFTKRAIEIMEARTNIKFTKFIQFSDGCGSQFKSQFSVADMCTLGHELFGDKSFPVIFNYFESNEGKSESDTIGANFKLRVENMILRNRDLVITTAEDLVKAYHSHCDQGSTGKFQFNLVECFPKILRVKKEERPAIEVKGIRSIHRIWFSGDGVKTSRVSCHDCCRLDAECPKCSALPVTIPQSKVEKCLSKFIPTWEEENHEEQISGDDEADSRDDVSDEDNDCQQSDNEGGDDGDDEEEEEEELEEIYAGVAVWSLLYRKYRPCIVRSFEELPINRQLVLKTKKPDTFYVEFIGMNRYNVVHRSKLIKMGQTPQDLLFAENDTNYQKALQMSR